ncbi:hypothetical protein MPC1_11700001 [Methylocella tundrae]|nr:hypothetical protein MPC1_11700001 [Methylocella tundrae]
MSSGAPLIATPHAFRGMNLDPAQLKNVTLAADARSFAAALLRADAERGGAQIDQGASDTRRTYQERFSFEAYRSALVKIAAPLVRG